MTGVHGRETTTARRSIQRLRYLAAALAFGVAAIHLFHPTLGVPALVAYAAAGTPLIDPRPAAFVLSGLAIIVGVNLAAMGTPRRPIYAAGIALMVVYVAGYFAWHTFGHGAWWPLGPERHWVSHSFAGILLGSEHLHPRNDPLGLLSKLAELALLIVLAVLYRLESDG